MGEMATGTCFSAQSRRWAIVATGTAALLAAVAGAVVVRGIFLSNDSMRYALTADQILAGRGLRYCVFDLPEKPDAAGTVPFTVQPPGLPVILAALGGVHPDRLWPGQALNIVSIALIAATTTLLSLRLTGIWPAFLAGIGSVLCFPILHVTHHLWSEPPFIASMMLSLLLLCESRASRYRWLLLAASGVFAALAISLRFAGIFLLPVLAWEVLIVAQRRGARLAFGAFLTSCTVPLLFAFGFLVRNYRLTGYKRGFEQPDPHRSIFAAFQGVVDMTASNAGLPLAIFVAVTLVVLLLLVAGFVLSRQSGQENRTTGDRQGRLDVLVVAIISYFVVIVHAMAFYQPVFEPRFSAPFAPLMLIVWVGALGRLGGDDRRGLPRRWTDRIVIGILLLLLAHGIHDSVKRVSLAPRDKLSDTQMFHWVVENCPKGSVITSNMSPSLAFYGGYSSFYLPHCSHNPRIPIPDEQEEWLPQKMRETGSEYMVLWTGEREMAGCFWGAHVAKLLANRASDAIFELVYNGPDGVAYRLR